MLLHITHALPNKNPLISDVVSRLTKKTQNFRRCALKGLEKEFWLTMLKSDKIGIGKFCASPNMKRRGEHHFYSKWEIILQGLQIITIDAQI